MLSTRVSIGEAAMIGRQQRMPEHRIKIAHLLVRLQFVERPPQALQIRQLPTHRRLASCTPIKIDQPDLSASIDQHIVRIEVSMPDTFGMKIGQRAPDRCRQGGIEGIRDESLGQSLHAGNLSGYQISAISHAGMLIACQQRCGHWQTRFSEFAEQAELAKRARAFATRPQVEILADPGGQSAAAIVAQYTRTERRLKKYDRTPSCALLGVGTGNLRKPLLIRFGNLCRIEQDRAINRFLDLCLDH